MLEHPREHQQQQQQHLRKSSGSFTSFTSFVRRSLRRSSGRRSSSTKSLSDSSLKPMMPCRNFSIGNDIVGRRTPGSYRPSSILSVFIFARESFREFLPNVSVFNLGVRYMI